MDNVTCRYCKTKIDREQAIKVKEKIYCCSESCVEQYKNKVSSTKVKSTDKPTENSQRRILTDTIQDLYISNGYKKKQINWSLIGTQISTIIKDFECKYSTITFVLEYMIDIKEMNLFNEKFNGSILNLVPFYITEAREYYLENQEIKKAIDDFDFTDDVRVIKKVDNKNKKIHNIDTRF